MASEKALIDRALCGEPCHHLRYPSGGDKAIPAADLKQAAELVTTLLAPYLEP